MAQRHEVRAHQFHEIVDPNTEMETLFSHLVFPEGPVWVPDTRALLFTDIPESTIYQSDGVALSVWRTNTNKANGLALDSDSILACEHATSCVVRYAGSERLVLASHYQGKELNSPNDIIVSRSGDIYFTDPLYGRLTDSWGVGVRREPELDFRGVFRLSGDELSLVADDFDAPNGLCLSLDEQVLFVNDTERQHIRVFELDSKGNYTGGAVWVETLGNEEGWPDGMKIDVQGNLYCSGPGGIHVFSALGVCIGILKVQPPVTNFCFGGRNGRDLYITAVNKLYRIPMKVAGPGFTDGHSP